METRSGARLALYAAMNKGPILATLLLLLSALPLAAEWTAGAEGDDRRAWAWISRIERQSLGPGEELVYTATLSYLRYESRERSGELSVDSPGLGAAVLYRIFGPRYSFSIGPGYEVRYTRRRIGGVGDAGIEHGVLGLADAALGVSRTSWINAGTSYSGANDWLAARAQFRQALSEQLRVGAEVGQQGNDDIRIREYGGLAEIPAGSPRTWLQFRAGQARIREANGQQTTRPYYSVGLVTSF